MSNRDCHGYSCSRAGKNIWEKSQTIRPRVQGRVITSGQSLGWNAKGSFFYSDDCRWITEVERPWLGISMGNAGLEKKIQKYYFPLHYGFYCQSIRCKLEGGCNAFSSTQGAVGLAFAFSLGLHGLPFPPTCRQEVADTFAPFLLVW